MVKSINCGADLINDVSGFNHDPFALIKLRDFNIPKVLHHMQGTPKTMQRVQNTKMFYLIFMTFLKKKFQILQIIKKS